MDLTYKMINSYILLIFVVEYNINFKSQTVYITSKMKSEYLQCMKASF